MSNRLRRGQPPPNYANNSEDDDIEYPYDQRDIDLFMERVPIDKDTAKVYLSRHSSVSNAIVQYFDDKDGIQDGDDADDDADDNADDNADANADANANDERPAWSPDELTEAVLAFLLEGTLQPGDAAGAVFLPNRRLDARDHYGEVREVDERLEALRNETEGQPEVAQVRDGVREVVAGLPRRRPRHHSCEPPRARLDVLLLQGHFVRAPLEL